MPDITQILIYKWFIIIKWESFKHSREAAIEGTPVPLGAQSTAHHHGHKNTQADGIPLG